MDILEIIETFNQYIKRVPQGAAFIAENFREENINIALTEVQNFSEGTLWLSQMSGLLIQNNVKVDFDISKINEYLEEINDGLEKQDYLLVADIFEYEIVPYFEEATLAQVAE